MALFKRRDPLTYNRAAYRFADAVRAAIPDPVAEYARLRESAMQRIRRLERAGYGGETTQRARDVFAKTARQISAQEAIEALPDAARFITSARGTVGGMREIERKTAQTFQDRGFDFVNRKNVKQFGEFLEWVGADKLQKIFYRESGGAPREGRTAENRTLLKDDLQSAFNIWLKNQ